MSVERAPKHRRTRRLNWILFAVGLAVVLFLGNRPDGSLPGAVAAQRPDPTPTPDPLATPVMPESPTQLDIGRNAYYYNCMPCHGDEGQGLTDEWRAVWVEDHQNCWDRGCHGGKIDDEGFPIPHFVPAVSGPQSLASFRTSDDLYEYLLRTHPPQRPGALSEDEYRALTVFLLHENGQLSTDDFTEAEAVEPPALQVVGVGAAVLGLAIIVVWGVRAKRRKPTSI